MSDTLTNALAQSAHSQSVLAGIQNPAVVNPLAGMGSAISAVGGMQGLAAKQGEQLVGQALQQATDAADGKDVRLGGGVATIRQFLEADLVDTMHVAVAPVEIGRGERLWTSPEDLLDRFHLESVPSPSGVTHLLFWRR